MGLQRKGRSSSAQLAQPGLARAPWHGAGSWQAGTRPAQHRNSPKTLMAQHLNHFFLVSCLLQRGRGTGTEPGGASRAQCPRGK